MRGLGGARSASGQQEMPASVANITELSGGPTVSGTANPSDHAPEPAADPERARSLQPLVEDTLARVTGITGLAPDTDLINEGLLDSLSRVALIDRLEQEFALEIPLEALTVDAIRSVERLSELLAAAGVTPDSVASPGQSSSSTTRSPLLVELRPGIGRPFILLPGSYGRASLGRALLPVLRTPRPIYCLQARAFVYDEEPQTTIEEMARTYAPEIRALQPEGPYAIGGYSFGALVAYELARQLRREGARLDLVLLIDPRTGRSSWPDEYAARGVLAKALAVPGYLAREPRQRVPLHTANLLSRARRTNRDTGPVGVRVARCHFAAIEAFNRYRLGPFDGDVTVVEVRDAHPWHPRPTELLAPHVSGTIETEPVRGTHTELVKPENVDRLVEPLAAIFRRDMARVNAEKPSPASA